MLLNILQCTRTPHNKEPSSSNCKGAEADAPDVREAGERTLSRHLCSEGHCLEGTFGSPIRTAFPVSGRPQHSHTFCLSFMWLFT